MAKRVQRKLDIYSELCPASSATVIGAGLVTIAMGVIPTGLSLVLAGIVVGLLGPFSKMLQKRKSHTKTN